MILESHTVHARDGFLYMFGGATVTNGAVIASLNDPWNPHILSKYAAHYVHDGFVRGDTLWASEGNASQVTAIDISDKTNPVPIVSQPTPGGYAQLLAFRKQ
mgnify:CR=1 FL=1